MNAEHSSGHDVEYTADEGISSPYGEEYAEDPRSFVARSIPADPELLAVPRERLAGRSTAGAFAGEGPRRKR